MRIKVFWLISIVFLFTGCKKELTVLPVENLKIEYGEKLDNTKLFCAKDSDENVKVSKVEGFNEKKIGEQKLAVTFTDGFRIIQRDIKVTVEDTKKPVIELKKDSITVTLGDNLELKDNIKYVKDSVDGDLKYSDKTVEKNGYYIDKGKLDTARTGNYDVKVIAIDKNGNKTEKSFKVLVKKKELTKKSTNNDENKNPGNAYKNNSSINSNNFNNSKGDFYNSKKSSSGTSGNSSNSRNSESSNSEQEKPLDSNTHQHLITVTGYPDVVYSRMFFESEYECDSWASNYWGPNEEWSARGYSSKQCSCGMWSPYFFYIEYWN